MKTGFLAGIKKQRAGGGSAFVWIGAYTGFVLLVFLKTHSITVIHLMLSIESSNLKVWRENHQYDLSN